jgi:serine phosphatase RsbU (regulator of sigma subunit)
MIGFLDTGSATLNWANMGHPTGLLLDGAGEVKLLLKSTCKPLGLFAEIGCSLGVPVVLEAGDAIVLVTDGAIETESPDGQQHGAEAVLRAVRAHLQKPAHEIVERVIEATRAHADGVAQEDDITVVVIKRTSV